MSDIVGENLGGQRVRQAQMRAFVRSIGMLPVLIILGILVQLAGVYFTGEGRFLTWQNLSIVAQQASINAVPLAAGDPDHSDEGAEDDPRDPIGGLKMEQPAFERDKCYQRSEEYAAVLYRTAIADEGSAEGNENR